MATIEAVRDQTPTEQFPVDPNVSIPKHVRDAAAAAEAFYKQAYVQPEPEAPAPTAEAAPEDRPEDRPAPQSEPQTPPVAQLHQDYAQPATPAEIKADDWAARYNSMYGRWTASERQNGIMKQQLNDLATELQRTQELLTRNAPQPEQAQNRLDHKQLITDQDREQYGDDLIDLTRRAALEAVSPELDQLRVENETLKRRVNTTAQGELKQHLTHAVPNWVAINRSPEFKDNWLRLRNIYTGQVRGEMLKAAYAAADAPKVIAIFKDFINEVKATGGEVPGAKPEQQVVQEPAPRQPALSLETLAAPGRARPSGGDANLPADKPTYTRAQIQNFYADVRRQVFAGRETVKQSIEQDIIAAQREGRVRG